MKAVKTAKIKKKLCLEWTFGTLDMIPTARQYAVVHQAGRGRWCWRGMELGV